MMYLIYLICSVPLILYLESRHPYSFVGKALGTLNIFEKVIFYAAPTFKEMYFLIALLESKKPEWFTIKDDI